MAALVWIGIHIGISGTRLRGQIVQRIGEGPFRGIFSVVSIATLVVLVRAWSIAPTALLWVPPNWLRWLLVLAMLPAFLLFTASLSRQNPTMVGSPGTALSPPRGIVRITRHPMLWSFAIWAAVHVIGNGDTASVVFFATFLVTALAGMPSIDAKMARRDPFTWQALSATTSIVPFAAVMQKRNRAVLRELSGQALIATILWVVMLLLHPVLFGVAPAVW